MKQEDLLSSPFARAVPQQFKGLKMEKVNMKRREFLKRSSVGLTSAAAMSLFLPVQASLAQRLSRISISSDDESSFANLRKEYLLAPDVTYFNHGSIGTWIPFSSWAF